MRRPDRLMKEVELESYIYFDTHIRQLPKKPDGTIDTMQPGFQDNDVDAFRHAYVSGVFTQEYGEKIATLLGWMNELAVPSAASARNIDLWNNSIGRKLGLTHRTRPELANAVKSALEAGALIINLSDGRRYQGAMVPRPAPDSSVIVLEESSSGANKVFFDFNISQTMTRTEFVEAIRAGRYPGYRVSEINGVDYPVSKRDSSDANNLG